MACGNDKKEYDATGTFEATEVTVSAKSTGEIKMFSVTEGQVIDSGTLVGKIDAYQLQQTSAQLEAQKRQLASSRSATDSRKLDLEKQLSSINQQITNAQR
ncbi:MAG: HlyD family secretion protein, partial [Prevotella sp.]|nr:HlyD family secretion protein [Prevotella sp.]